ncbi:hypothetical protein ACX80Z_06680 [Arthrobacter sp. TMT4-20]
MTDVAGLPRGRRRDKYRMRHSDKLALVGVLVLTAVAAAVFLFAIL